MDKKIIINASILDENPTGLGVYAKNVSKKIYKMNKNCKVFSAVDIDGIDVEKISGIVTPRYKIKGGIARFLWTQLVLPFKASKNDVIYHPFQYISLFSRSKQFITIHDFIPLYYPSVAKHQNFYYKFIMPIFLKKSEKIICISENTKKDILKFYNVDESKIKVIYNGFDNSEFNIKNVNKEVLKKYKIDYDYMLMVGAAYRHKNIEAAIKAFKNIDSDMKLVIVGKESAYIKDLRILSQELDIEDKIKFVGYVPDEDLVSLYGNSYAFLYTTLYEGFGLPILEAMSCGTVVLSANNSSLPEVYGDGALSFDASDVDDVTEKIKFIIDNKEYRDSLLLKSKKIIEKFSWDRTAENINSLLYRGGDNV